MSSIREIYSVITRADTQGIEGYNVNNKYHDPLRIKEQRELQKSNDRSQTRKPVNVGKKPSFIDEVQKVQSKLPGPTTYEPKLPSPKSKTQTLVVPTKRQTIFDQMQHLIKKNNFPAAGNYDKVQVDTDKSRLHSNISKAEKSNYLDDSMRSYLQVPGVGNYNSHHAHDNRASKWVNNPQRKATQSIKLPPVGSYSPLPVSYQLFQNDKAHKKRYKSFFNKQERFKRNKDKTLPFYNILSEWGMKNQHAKKDILTRISSPMSNRSVYH